MSTENVSETTEQTKEVPKSESVSTEVTENAVPTESVPAEEPKTEATKTEEETKPEEPKRNIQEYTLGPFESVCFHYLIQYSQSFCFYVLTVNR